MIFGPPKRVAPPPPYMGYTVKNRRHKEYLCAPRRVRNSIGVLKNVIQTFFRLILAHSENIEKNVVVAGMYF